MDLSLTKTIKYMITFVNYGNLMKIGVGYGCGKKYDTEIWQKQSSLKIFVLLFCVLLFYLFILR